MLDLSILTDEGNDGYWQQPIPSSRDLEVKALIDSSDPQALVMAVREQHYSMLMAFAERMAALAVRTKNGGFLHTGLHALALAGLQQSYDALVVVALFYHASEALGLDPERVFGAVGSRVDPEADDILQRFLKRSPEDRSLEAMGYAVGADSDGFRYERKW